MFSKNAFSVSAFPRRAVETVSGKRLSVSQSKPWVSTEWVYRGKPTRISGMEQAELKFRDDIVTVLLTDQQRQQLEPLVRRQAQDRRGLLLISVAPHIEDGNVFHLQAVYLRPKQANRVLKIIKEE
jgi:hypothetical protein